ncbi:MFS transporter [Runella slithyformis]|uniref:Major facilitator superfamily MFS_1 n=1 Tax=Runella slithyformis (strain ATCC 29530 / DSM 19594 / LMG 11500 / NCIMB 11436 / LSU 4) TaxID=761193 RepID=A0A7U3ZM17_RUNSL|nr:MFS transporter [Runella slithyformis]AEI49699.1 major facilitator superfamily MFS_1 [Runella slithyformis DSM 19594]
MQTTTIAKTTLQHLFSIPVIVAALGYFVDIYDLLLFGIVRIPSLQSFGLSEREVSDIGAIILNWQMTGLLLGGILWGVLGDKKGRLSVLFGSILTYSIANIACGFVQSPEMYKMLRFVAGIGLAGELGAGITLVSEILPKQLRAIGTSLVAGVGLLGAVAAYFTVEFFDWRTAYFIGGGMGITLLLLRIGVFESGVFENIKSQKQVQKGNFFSLFTNQDRLIRYLKCIGMGLPTWFVIGILATFGNEFGKALPISESIKPGLSIMWCYIGLSMGDLASGFLSHGLRSRKKAVLYLMLFTLVFAAAYLFGGVQRASVFYGLTLLLGFGIGYWAMFVTIGAEQFGTNLRATAATTIPNMVRGTVVLMTTLFGWLKNEFNVIESGALVGALCFVIGFYCTLTMAETHDKDLDFLED